MFAGGHLVPLPASTGARPSLQTLRQASGPCQRSRQIHQWRFHKGFAFNRSPLSLQTNHSVPFATNIPFYIFSAYFWVSGNVQPPLLHYPLCLLESVQEEKDEWLKLFESEPKPLSSTDKLQWLQSLSVSGPASQCCLKRIN